MSRFIQVHLAIYIDENASYFHVSFSATLNARQGYHQVFIHKYFDHTSFVHNCFGLNGLFEVFNCDSILCLLTS